jgi:23S rRNA (uridine2552-2'-O)-methyltransferase
MPGVVKGQRWLDRHVKDPYVLAAQKAGYRSRSSLKLLEIHQKERLFKPDMAVVDLGAAPGGWSQVLAKIITDPKGFVIALDKLPIAPISERVITLQGDFTEQSTLDNLNNLINGRKLDWVLSDMAPNFSGLKSVDIPTSYYLAELALEFAKQVLAKNGSHLVKIFQGTGFDEYHRQIKQLFEKVSIIKPKASRAASREMYFLARGFKL